MAADYLTVEVIVLDMERAQAKKSRGDGTACRLFSRSRLAAILRRCTHQLMTPGTVTALDIVTAALDCSRISPTCGRRERHKLASCSVEIYALAQLLASELDQPELLADVEVATCRKRCLAPG